jgi:hypothetical protein
MDQFHQIIIYPSIRLQSMNDTHRENHIQTSLQPHPITPEKPPPPTPQNQIGLLIETISPATNP